MRKMSLGWQQTNSWSKTKFFKISNEITEHVIDAALQSVPGSHLIQVSVRVTCRHVRAFCVWMGVYGQKYARSALHSEIYIH